MFHAQRFSTLWGLSQRQFSSASLRSVPVISNLPTVNKAKLDLFRAQKSLTVTEFNTQYDELRQINEFGNERVATKPMIEGTRVHHELDRESKEKTLLMDTGQAELLQDEPILKYAGRPEISRMLETIMSIHALSVGSTREVYIRSITHDGSRKLRGVIDSLNVDKFNNITVGETKTTHKREVTEGALRMAYHQALIYRWMIQQLWSAKNPIEYILKLFNTSEEEANALRQSEGHTRYFKQAINESRLNPHVCVEFIKMRKGQVVDVEEFTLIYDEKLCLEVMQSRLDLLNGVRGPFDFPLWQADRSREDLGLQHGFMLDDYNSSDDVGEILYSDDP